MTPTPTLQNIWLRSIAAYDATPEYEWLIKDMFCLAAERYYVLDDIGIFLNIDRSHVSEHIRRAITRYNILAQYRKRFAAAGFESPKRCPHCGSLIRD